MKELSEQQRELGTRLFAAIDRDGDGKLSQYEFAHLMRLWAHGNSPPSAATVSLLFQQTAAGSTRIDLEGFFSWLGMMVGALSEEDYMQSLNGLLELAKAEHNRPGLTKQAAGLIRGALERALMDFDRRVFNALVREAEQRKSLGRGRLPVVDALFADVAFRLLGVSMRQMRGPGARQQFEEALVQDVSFSLSVNPSRLTVQTIEALQGTPSSTVVLLRVKGVAAGSEQLGEPSVRGAVRVMRDQMLNPQSALLCGTITKQIDSQWHAAPYFGEPESRMYTDVIAHVEDLLCPEGQKEQHKLHAIFRGLAGKAARELRVEVVKDNWREIAGRIGVLPPGGDTLDLAEKCLNVHQYLELQQAKGIESLLFAEFALLLEDTAQVFAQGLSPEQQQQWLLLKKHKSSPPRPQSLSPPAGYLSRWKDGYAHSFGELPAAPSPAVATMVHQLPSDGQYLAGIQSPTRTEPAPAPAPAACSPSRSPPPDTGSPVLPALYPYTAFEPWQSTGPGSSAASRAYSSTRAQREHQHQLAHSHLPGSTPITMHGLSFRVGGREGKAAVASVQLLDARYNEWVPVAPMLQCRDQPAVNCLEGLLYAAGGFGAAGEALSSLERYQPQRDCWELLEDMAVPRGAAGMGVLAGAVWAVGGSTGSGDVCGAVERYDASTGSWSPCAPLHVPRRGCSTASAKGRLYVVGGLDDVGDPVEDIECLDPRDGAWIVVAEVGCIAPFTKPKQARVQRKSLGASSTMMRNSSTRAAELALSSQNIALYRRLERDHASEE